MLQNLPASLSSPIFDLPASRVYGRNGSFTEPDCQYDDPMCGPWEPVLDAHNEMTVGFNNYLGPAFPQVYHDPLTNSLPYDTLMDFFSHAFSARFDPFNNLYILDLTRDRVLVYQAAPLYDLRQRRHRGSGAPLRRRHSEDGPGGRQRELLVHRALRLVRYGHALQGRVWILSR